MSGNAQYKTEASEASTAPSKTTGTDPSQDEDYKLLQSIYAAHNTLGGSTDPSRMSDLNAAVDAAQARYKSLRDKSREEDKSSNGN
jgi:hypothetical protein